MGSIFAPGFHSAGDGMKATLVISPLRRGLETFFGLYTAKGENGQKRRPFKINYGLLLSEQAVPLIYLFCRSAVLRQNTLRAPLVCPNMSVAEANRKEEKSVHTKR